VLARAIEPHGRFPVIPIMIPVIISHPEEWPLDCFVQALTEFDLQLNQR